MTTPTAPAARPQPDTYLDTPHQHTRSCFWDYLECRWQCPPRPDTSHFGPAPGQNPDAPTTAPSSSADALASRRP
jgi:hypothetical protein